MADTTESVSPLDSLSQQDYEHYRRSGELPAPAGDEKTLSDPSPAAAAEEKTPESGNGEPDDDDPAEFTKRGLSKRFYRLTQQRKEAEARAAELEQRLARLEQGSRPVNDAPQQQKPRPEGEPRQEDFETIGEWQSAVIDYRLERKLQQERAAAVEYVQRQQAQTAKAEWDARQDIARAKHEDYDEAVDSVDVPQTPALPAIIDAIRQSETGPEISYYLAKNPKELARIAELSPTRAVAEVGKIEARLTAAPDSAPAAKVSSAPRPPALANGTHKAEPSIYDPDLPFPDYERMRMGQLKRKPF